METMTIKGEPREACGTRAARALRDCGRIPAVIYGHGEPPESVSLPMHEVKLALAHGVRMWGVEVAGKSQQYLLKAVQYDHLDQLPIHLDLTRVALDERVKVRVGIELRGVPRGITEGGILDHYMADIELECLFTEIPSTLHPVINDLGVGDTLLVKDLELPAGVVALANPDDRIASVRALVEAPEPEAAEEAQEEAAEPEMISKARKEADSSEGKS